MFIFKRSTAGLCGALITIVLVALLSGCAAAPQPHLAANAAACATYETRVCRNWGPTSDCACVDPRRISIQR